MKAGGGGSSSVVIEEFLSVQAMGAANRTRRRVIKTSGASTIKKQSYT